LGEAVRRRDSVKATVGAAIAWPQAAGAQPSEKVRLVAVLTGAIEKDAVTQMRLAAFRDGLMKCIRIGICIKDNYSSAFVGRRLECV